MHCALIYAACVLSTLAKFAGMLLFMLLLTANTRFIRKFVVVYISDTRFVYITDKLCASQASFGKSVQWRDGRKR